MQRARSERLLLSLASLGAVALLALSNWLSAIDDALYGLFAPEVAAVSTRVALITLDEPDGPSSLTAAKLASRERLMQAVAAQAPDWLVLSPELSHGAVQWPAPERDDSFLVVPGQGYPDKAQALQARFSGWLGAVTRISTVDHGTPPRMLTLATRLAGGAAPSTDSDAQHGLLDSPGVLAPRLGASLPLERLSAAAMVDQGSGGEGLLRGRVVFLLPERPGTANHHPGTGLQPFVAEAVLAAAVLDHQIIRIASPIASAAWGVLWVLTLLLALRYLQPSAARGAWALIALAMICCTFASVRGLNLWPGLVAPLVVMLLIAPLWALRRIELIAQALHDDVRRLNAEPSPFPEPPKRIDDRRYDAVEQHVAMLRQASSRVRSLRRFLDDALANVPDPTLVVTADGFVAIANSSARRYFRQMGVRHPDGAQLPYLLARFERVDPSVSGPDFSWWDIIDSSRAKRHEAGIEVRDSSQRHWVVRCALATGAKGRQIGWIATLHDISAIRDAERRRDETLRFLSHDLRSPQAAIITLLELERTQGTVGEHGELFERLERLARLSLALADDFVQLARAETAALTMRELDLSALLEQSIDGAWAAAKARNIRIDVIDSDLHAVILGDGTLINRAIANLIDNAIKYSPPDSTIRCRTELRSGEGNRRWAVVSIRDHGYGIATDDQPKLFRRFARVQHDNQPAAQGAGLGLAFVKTVMDRHGGKIEVASRPNEGSDFRLLFPAFESERD